MKLLTAIDELYQAFSLNENPKSIDACTCCMSANDICTLLSKPLKQVTADQLSGYASSVLLTVGSERDLRYFFPRILEISIQDSSWWPDRAVVLGKLPLANWNNWPVKEKVAITTAVAAAFESDISNSKDAAWDVDSWICGLALAGADLQPFFTLLEDPTREELVLEYYELNSEQLAKGKLGNAFWDKTSKASAPVVAWFHSPRVQAIVARAQQSKYG